MTELRIRVAPSPTGYPHIGTLYQALIDKAVALKANGKFILRIEDTDQTRFVSDAEESIYSALSNFGLEPDESPKLGGNCGPYRQSERLAIYQKYADELIDKGHAYYCFCSKERLEEVRNEQQKNGHITMYDKKCRNLDITEAKKRVANGESHVIRMKIPENTKITVHDLNRGDIEFDSNLIDDQVLLKADGFPTYHLAVVVDDHLMQISHVVRGPEWITSYPKHKLLYDYFGWKMPVIVHTPILTNMDGSKLSKRNGHASVDWYLRRGYLPDAVLNFISLLGWSHPDQKEIFSFDEFVQVFDLKNLSSVGAKFDLVKLDWMNNQHLQKLEAPIFVQKMLNWLDHCLNTEYKGAADYETFWTHKDYNALRDFITSLDSDTQNIFADMNKERIKKFEDLLPMNSFFIKDFALDVALLTSQKSAAELDSQLNWILHRLEETEWNLAELKSLEIKFVERAKEIGWKTGEVFYPIRIAVCGSKISPPLFESMYILGKAKTLLRISHAIDKL